ncbi:hypothetical protein B5807_02236 [Epicoccum nigrum]|uniref:Uncharacterized protein n=1 Tax=Epicoccum nigrum TaxID=105696 RepID=A0A1Y2MAQ2_EPING|nr:hypothetical protein B5807_02236 [Epicoccum nigrum]
MSICSLISKLYRIYQKRHAASKYRQVDNQTHVQFLCFNPPNLIQPVPDLVASPDPLPLLQPTALQDLEAPPLFIPWTKPRHERSLDGIGNALELTRLPHRDYQPKDTVLGHQLRRAVPQPRRVLRRVDDVRGYHNVRRGLQVRRRKGPVQRQRGHGHVDALARREVGVDVVLQVLQHRGVVVCGADASRVDAQGGQEFGESQADEAGAGAELDDGRALRQVGQVEIEMVWVLAQHAAEHDTGAPGLQADVGVVGAGQGCVVENHFDGGAQRGRKREVAGQRFFCFFLA